MNNRLAKFFAIILTSVLFIAFSIAFVFFLIQDNTNSEHIFSAELLRNDIKIFENEYGIGHIFAEEDDDLFFAIGYYQAEKRLWQMDFNRRMALGRLSEVIGEDAIDIDKFLRCFEIKNIAWNNWIKLSGKSQSILNSFAAGINFYIQENKNHLPVEFGLLDYEPEMWQPWHSILIGRLLSFEFSLGIWIDIINGKIENKIGLRKLESFIPDYKTFPFVDKVIDSTTINMIDEYSDNLSTMSDKVGLFRGSIGSNCWVTSYKDKNIQHQVLANDPHTPISLPARWLQIHITNNNINSVGLMIPGIPLPIIGRNDFSSWGITSTLIDDFDYYVEKLSKDGKFYFKENSVKNKIDFVIDTLLIKNKVPQFYYQRKTDKSIIISDFHLANNLSFLTKSKFTKKNGKKFNQQGLTFDWTGKNNSDEILSLYKVNKSINYDEFLQSFNTWCTPGLNFHYINKNGDYKILPAGNSPIRFEKHNPLIPQIRSSSLTGWKEQIKLQKYYQIDDTAKNGYLVSANNKLFISKDYISNYWEPISRFDRINEVLSLEKPHNVPRAKYLQNDLLSPYAKQLLKICLPIIIDKKILLNSLEKQALNKLCRWNYILSSKDNTSSVYTLFFYNLLKCTFQDELGDKLFSEYTFISSVSTRKIFELIDENKSNVFDNVRTKEIENRNYTIFIAFKNAVKQGTQLFGTDDISKWKYGLIHTIEPEHILSRNKFIKNVFEIGKYPIGGNNTTILNTDWNYSVPFSSVVYPSVRFVCDLSDTNIYFSLPGGVSGNPQNSNFKDQFQLWLNGGYISISLSKNPNSNFKLKTLIKKKK